MGEFWPNQEIERKNSILGPYSGLSRNAQIAVRCAECILSRAVAADECPGFTASEIRVCTGLSEMVTTHTMQRLESCGVLTHKLPLSSVPYASKRPKIYLPTQKNLQNFFKPAVLPSCERTTRRNFLENFKPTMRVALAYFAILTQEDSEYGDVWVGKPNIHAMSHINHQTLDSIFRFFERTGLIIKTADATHGNDRLAACYMLSDRGKWLAGGLPEYYRHEVNTENDRILDYTFKNRVQSIDFEIATLPYLPELQVN